jgi:hypothetical protein
MKKVWVVLILIIVLGGAWWLMSQEKADSPTEQLYSSEELNLSFEYPEGYFIEETDQSTGERNRHAIVIFEDNQFNRDLVGGKILGTDSPPTVTISLFQNNLDNYTAKSFVEGNNFSNFKLSDGVQTETEIAGEPALRYQADGLWQSNNVVVARPDYVYMFTVFFNSPEDELVSIFENLLKTVEFSGRRTPTSADNAPPGSIHNLPLPKAVSAVKKLASETYNVPEGEVIVMTAFEKEWTDSCLGLGQAYESCALVITPGYEVTVSAGRKNYTYRTDADGNQIRLEN